MKTPNEQDYTKILPIKSSQSWEDFEILSEALKIGEKDTVLSVLSGGDNTISFLTKNPKKIYAISTDIRELAYIELKKVIYKILEYDYFLEFVGIKPSENRENLYAIKLRKFLSEPTQEYFDFNIYAISNGIIFAGDLERKIKKFKTFVLPAIHGKKDVRKLLELESSKEKEEYYNTVWCNKRWNLLFNNKFSSKDFLQKMSDNPEFYNCSTEDLSKNVQDRIKNIVVNTDLSENYYMQYILNGTYELDNLPYAYRQENFYNIKENIDKIEIVSKDVVEFLRDNAKKLTKMNFKNIFEYMKKEQIDEIYNILINDCKKGTKLAYWNILPREHYSDKFVNNIEYKENESKELFKNNKSIVYDQFILEEIR